MTNWIDSMYYWIGSMSESELKKRIEAEKMTIDWLTELIPTAHMMGSSTEDELKAQRERAERRLSKLQYKLLKIKVNCPQCGRSLKGATKDMIGDIGVCPKCKAEFAIEQKGVKLRDEQKQ